ncbi:DUF4138 domain-containing protein [Aureibaculum algae]|uniref:DUF4138 domain-containing protein n=1 Tax=Aureibaculum algae TaxID=2584122 RepID=A0A5B7TMJ1_9FLAO|nr:DUF4138 domain-containing protein [Aureibaculum algae]QCX37390.1 DUF4138 domain-containing protein [Aureibaculum algae]
MKTYITFILLAYSISITSQESLDTIYANDKKSVALFFPTPIRQGITGSRHFVFTYNTETEQYLGLLQAKPGATSNLLVIGDDGSVFSYIISYNIDLQKLNYFIPKTKSIGNEIPKNEENKNDMVKIDSLSKFKVLDLYRYRKEYFEKFSAHLLTQKHPVQKVKHGIAIIFSLKKLVYDRSEVYAVIEINNRSGIDFEIDYINFYSVNTNKRRKSSFQKLQLEPIYTHNIPEVFMNGKTNKFVIVLPKFTLGSSEKLSIQIKEKNGNREIKM